MVPSAPPRYCAAPWTQASLRVDGETWPCCYLTHSLGNWQEQGLRRVWNSLEYQDFRQAILEGRFPHPRCAQCFHSHTTRPLGKDLGLPFHWYLSRLTSRVPPRTDLSAIRDLEPLLQLSTLDPASESRISRGRARLSQLEVYCRQDPEAMVCLGKFRRMLAVIEAFLSDELTPHPLAPYRQVSLQVRCNARCRHCNYTYLEKPISPPRMPDAYLEEAFCVPEDLLNFSTTTEFMLFPRWQEVGTLLAQQRVGLILSTNGMLLTPENFRFLVDQRIISALNLSLEGATAETVEYIRRGVDFARLTAHLAYIFEYAEEQEYDFQLTLSMILLRSNYLELPGLIRLLARLRGQASYPSRMYIHCQGLTPPGANAGYRAFYEAEHHSRVPVDAMQRMLVEALAASREMGIEVRLFTAFQLETFVAQGCPLPPFMGEGAGDVDA